MVRKVFTALLILVVIYLGIGLAFHIKWKSELEACREVRRSRGEFVEPEVFPVLGIFFDMTWWPVYTWANVYHYGTPFATPCIHSGNIGGPEAKIPVCVVVEKRGEHRAVTEHPKDDNTY